MTTSTRPSRGGKISSTETAFGMDRHYFYTMDFHNQIKNKASKPGVLA